jgi:GTP-binding protein SAR1
LLWPAYFTAVDAVVFVIDAMDIKRFDQAACLLDEILTNDRLAGVPFLIFGNKVDCKTSASESQLRSAFQLASRLTGKDRKRRLLPPGARAMELFMISVSRRQGYREGFAWLAQHIR